jgi:hypothetical protein
VHPHVHRHLPQRLAPEHCSVLFSFKRPARWT